MFSQLRTLGFVSLVALAGVGCLGSPTSRHLVSVGDPMRVEISPMPAKTPIEWQAVSFKDGAWTEQVTAFSPTLDAAQLPSDVQLRRVFDIGADYASFTSLSLDFKPGAPYDVFINGQSLGTYDCTQKVSLSPPAGLLQA